MSRYLLFISSSLLISFNTPHMEDSDRSTSIDCPAENVDAVFVPSTIPMKVLGVRRSAFAALPRAAAKGGAWPIFDAANNMAGRRATLMTLPMPLQPLQPRRATPLELWEQSKRWIPVDARILTTVGLSLRPCQMQLISATRKALLAQIDGAIFTALAPAGRCCVRGEYACAIQMLKRWRPAQRRRRHHGRAADGRGGQVRCLIANKGRDANALRRCLHAECAETVFPGPSNRKCRSTATKPATRAAGASRRPSAG